MLILPPLQCPLSKLQINPLLTLTFIPPQPNLTNPCISFYILLTINTSQFWEEKPFTPRCFHLRTTDCVTSSPGTSPPSAPSLASPAPKHCFCVGPTISPTTQHSKCSLRVFSWWFGFGLAFFFNQVTFFQTR